MHACTPTECKPMHALMMERLAEITSFIWQATSRSPLDKCSLWDRWDTAAWVDGLAMRTRSTEDRIGGSGVMSGRCGRKRDGEEREEWHWQVIVSH